jgi:hypothetical protein
MKKIENRKKNPSIFRILAAYRDSRYPRSLKKKRVDLGGPSRQCA